MRQPYVPLSTLTERVEILLSNRLQIRTLRGYNNVVKGYAECMRNYDIIAFPPSVHSLTTWMAYLSGTCTANSIANYLSAIGDYCRMNGFDYDTPRKAYQLKSMLQGIRILYPRQSIYKKPISVEHLHQIHASVDHSTLEGTTFFAMASCAFFGLLRLGEITLHTDPRRTLKRSHLINETTDGIYLGLPASKTDSTWQGSNVYLARLPSIICPVRALKNMLTKRKDNNPTLFLTRDLNTFTRTRFLFLLQTHLSNEPLISGHSFRAGGATWAANLGLTELDICRMGRWSSQAFRRYIRNHPMLQHLTQQHPLNPRTRARP